jgi:nicotinamidase-related amidase
MCLVDLDRCALVVVDVQRGFDDPSWGPRNNPSCEAHVAALIEAWRRARRPIVFVRHDSRQTGSPLAPGAPGNAFKREVTGESDLLVTKEVNSAFYGEPDLDAWLRERGVEGIAVCGITTDHCCSSTARMAANLGHRVLFVDDATHTFDRPAPDGGVIPADEVHRVSVASLHGEFAEIVRTSDLTGTKG